MTNIFNAIKEKNINAITLSEVKYLIKYTESLEKELNLKQMDKILEAIALLQKNYNDMSKRDFSVELKHFFDCFNSGLIYGDE